MGEEKHGMKTGEMKEMIEVFSEKIPALLNSLTDVLYGKTSAEKYGLAVANFYRTLKDSGMTDEQAFRLTEQYMSSLNLGKLIEQAVGSGRGRHGSDEKGDEGRHGIQLKIKRKADEDDD
jgi:hypothetical protein